LARRIIFLVRFVVSPAAFCFLALVAPAWPVEPLVATQTNRVSTGFFGFGRKVESETLVLPGASAVVREQGGRERAQALREARTTAQREQDRLAEARRIAEADALASVASTPSDAVSAETSLHGIAAEPVADQAQTAETTPAETAGGEQSAPAPEAGETSAPPAAGSTPSEPAPAEPAAGTVPAPAPVEAE
jgi:hypothetical protein